MCVRVDGHTYPTPTHLSYTLFHPVGVCALISPWNVPFMTSTWKVAPALAFGNTAVLKMSELSPLTAARLGELALEAGIPAGVLNIVHGYGAETGEPLVPASGCAGDLLHRFDGDRKSYRQSGGIEEVLDGTRRKKPLRRLRRRRFRSRVGRCRLYDFLQQRGALHGGFAHFGAENDLCGLRREIHGSGAPYPGGRPLDEKTIIGPMISPDHLAKVRRYIELGPKEGATLMCGGAEAPELDRRPQEREISSSHGICGCRQPHAYRSGGDFRPRRLFDSVR